jgi:DNA-binding transcriptional MerR regulator
MNIGQLARQAGVPIDTVRYYERQQLLPTAARSAGGYRIFGEPDLRRLRFIRRAKTLGFSLEEIAELLALSDRHHRTWAACATRRRPACRTSHNGWPNCSACTPRFRSWSTPAPATARWISARSWRR